MDWTKTKKRTMLYEGGVILIWQYPVVLFEAWTAWVCSFLQEKPPEEENDKIYGGEETVKKLNHIEINDEKGKNEIDNLFVLIIFMDKFIYENFFFIKIIKINYFIM